MWAHCELFCSDEVHRPVPRPAQRRIQSTSIPSSSSSLWHSLPALTVTRGRLAGPTATQTARTAALWGTRGPSRSTSRGASTRLRAPVPALCPLSHLSFGVPSPAASAGRTSSLSGGCVSRVSPAANQPRARSGARELRRATRTTPTPGTCTRTGWLLGDRRARSWSQPGRAPCPGSPLAHVLSLSVGLSAPSLSVPKVAVSLDLLVADPTRRHEQVPRQRHHRPAMHVRAGHHHDGHERCVLRHRTQHAESILLLTMRRSDEGSLLTTHLLLCCCYSASVGWVGNCEVTDSPSSSSPCIHVGLREVSCNGTRRAQCETLFVLSCLTMPS
jgi:hypothetical protein